METSILILTETASTRLLTQAASITDTLLIKRIIHFDTLYERGEYEIVAVFLSQVYRKSDDIFKYYQFFGADTQAEFDEFYTNIKALALYDTGVSADYGDSFITLSTCAYHTENGRLVVVARKAR
jgi:sortase B